MSLNIRIPVRLNTNNDKTSSRIVIKRGCINSVTLEVSIYYNGGLLEIPQGATAKMRMLSGKDELFKDNPTIEGNKIIVPVIEEMQSPGDNKCELIIMHGDSVFITTTFPITVEDNVHNDSNLTESEEYDTFVKVLGRVENVLPTVNEAYEVAQETQELFNDSQTSLNQLQTSITNANTATVNADTKANLANNAATNANQKATLADQKAQQAQAIIDQTAPIINTNLQATYADKGAFTGTFITTQTADNALVELIKIEGETVQGGEPTPDNPIPLRYASGFDVVSEDNSNPSQEDKINISFPLMGIGSIRNTKNEKIGDEWFDVKRVNEIVIDGSNDEGWSFATDSLSTTGINAYFTTNFSYRAKSHNIKCDKFKPSDTSLYDIDKEGIRFNNTLNAITIKINKSRLVGWDNSLSSVDKANLFTTWLVSNQITLQVERVEYVYTKVDPIYLKSYKGVTNVFTTSDPQVNMVVNFKSELWSDSYLKGVDISKKASKTQDAIIVPTFTNAWVVDGVFGYYLNPFGELRFVGSIKSGTVGSSAFILPVGYRPLTQKRVVCNSNDAFGYVVIGTDGTVKPYGNNTYVSLDGISVRLDV